MANIDTVLAKLDRVKQTGAGRWVAKSPLREDKTPSLHIRLTPDEKILIHDFGGSSVDEIVSAMGLNLADLMPDKPDYLRGKPAKHRQRIPASDILQFIAFEATVVITAANFIASGQSLTESDLARATLARDRLSDAVLECVQ